MSAKRGQSKGIQMAKCSRCDELRDCSSKRYCKKCHAKYMREYRKDKPLTEDQRYKAIVRRKTNMRIKRGLLLRKSCEVCDNKEVEAHHDDYGKPYEIRWFCRVHHLIHHKYSRMNIKKNERKVA